MSRNNTLLALDAAFGTATAALITANETCLAECDANRPHSQAILPMLDSLLEQAGISWNGLDLLAIGTGPGSFTGLRVAAATLAGVNARLGLPMLSLPSLAITALQSGSDDEIRVIEDARSGEAYLGHYRGATAIEADRVVSWKDEIASMPPANFISIGEPAIEMQGWTRLQPQRSRAEALAMLAAAELDRCSDVAALPRYRTPVYIRPSQAERSAMGNA